VIVDGDAGAGVAAGVAPPVAGVAWSAVSGLVLSAATALVPACARDGIAVAASTSPAQYARLNFRISLSPYKVVFSHHFWYFRR
jgi:hypothetical protein